MSWWSSNQSNMINGTDGAVFHPLINRNELLYIFAADLCRYACAALLSEHWRKVRPRTSSYYYGLVCPGVVAPTAMIKNEVFFLPSACQCLRIWWIIQYLFSASLFISGLSTLPMWKMWRWKASRHTDLHPPVMSSWVPKTTPLMRVSVCQLEIASAPGCSKSAFVEKVNSC